MRTGLAVGLMLMLSTVSAQALDCGSNSARIQGKLIVRGDSVAVLNKLKADRKVALTNRYGAVIGQSHEFYNGRRLLQINTQNGVVSSICRA